MKKAKKSIVENIEIPEGVTITLDKGLISFKGKKGESSENCFDPMIEIKQEDKKLIISSKVVSRTEKRKIKTFKAHILNRFKGILEPFIYKLKICSGHFPMNVSLAKDEIEIKNFLGEKVPRKVKIKPGAEVKLEGDLISIESVDKNLAGQIAADIEQLTRIRNKDNRIFQDGIYIIEKAGKPIK